MQHTTPIRNTFVAILIVAAVAAVIYCIWYLNNPYAVSGAVSAEKVYATAIATRNIDICDKVHMNTLSDVTDGELREVCYEAYAWAHPTEDICSRIGYEFRCVNATAVASKNPAYCLNMLSTASQSLCVSDVAIKLDDRSQCGIFKDRDRQTKCETFFANGGFQTSP